MLKKNTKYNFLDPHKQFENMNSTHNLCHMFIWAYNKKQTNTYLPIS